MTNTAVLATTSVAFLDALVLVSAGADFVAEGAPIPVVAGSTTPGPTLTPHNRAMKLRHCV